MLFKSLASILLVFSTFTAIYFIHINEALEENSVEEIDKRSFETWQLVFSDEFSGTSLDQSKWEYQTGCGETYGKGNLHCYTEGTGNIEVKNGLLVITAKIEEMEDKNFTSGRIRQLGNGALYGKYVFRARLPAGARLWPALWLKTKETGCYQEIDVIETQGENPSRFIFTAHLGLNRSNIVRHGTANKTTIDVVNHFHDYQVVWSPESIAWYVDGKLYYEATLARSYWEESGKIPCSIEPFSQEEGLIINLAVGGSMYNSKYEKLLPEMARQNWTKSTLELDYVRVYQLK